MRLKSALAALFLPVLLLPAVPRPALAAQATGTETPTETETALDARIRERFAALMPDVKIQAIEASPLQASRQVVTNLGIFYISEDLRRLVQGTVYDIANIGSETGSGTGSEITNLTEQRQGRQRLESLMQMQDQMLVFPAKDEQYRLTVFTDSSCGYCKKLHSQIAQYQALGIGVSYLAFPRGGEHSSSARQMAAAWCAKDPHKAMTELQNGQPLLQPQGCDQSRIGAMYRLGRELGINETPVLVLPNGELIRGYLPPATALALLQSKDPKNAGAAD